MDAGRWRGEGGGGAHGVHIVWRHIARPHIQRPHPDRVEVVEEAAQRRLRPPLHRDP